VPSQRGERTAEVIRGLSFGSVADQYERYRLDYSDDVVDAVLQYAGRPVRSALEVGRRPRGRLGRGSWPVCLPMGRRWPGAPKRRAGPPSFTPLPAANDLLLADPFAFLVAVIFDQGIPAERAWRAPYDLLRSLGYLDPERVAADDQAVRAAINQPPKLHRFVDRLPEWVSAAARRVVTDYGGDAGRIWGDRPTAIQLMQRLEQFQGIGQKKAAMAVEILERDLHVEVTDMRGSDIAYDVHVRRVFLRAGLAQYDGLEHMLDVARSAHPERPGAIDYPAWLVGRQWCRAGVPDCPNCVLSDACPKLITAASTVRGA